jgi:hypothetical protein
MQAGRMSKIFYDPPSLPAMKTRIQVLHQALASQEWLIWLPQATLGRSVIA